jgi:uncharacterized membrane protein
VYPIDANRARIITDHGVVVAVHRHGWRHHVAEITARNPAIGTEITAALERLGW